MKRTFIWNISLVCILFLTACSTDEEIKANDNKGDVQVRDASLSDSEKQLTELFTDTDFAYELKIKNNDINSFEIIIDYYTHGTFKETIAHFGTGLEQNNTPSYRLFIFRQMLDKETEKWLALFGNKDGYSSMETEGKKIIEYTGTAYGQANLPFSMNKGEEKIIGTMVRTNKDSTAILHTIDTEESLTKATDYEEAYIIKIKID